MRIGVVYPQTEYPSDPLAIRDYVQAVEGMGYTHILAYDHILGANPQRPGGWKGPYTYRDSFQEPLVLYSYMAALSENLEFVTGIIILPQRQTAVFAKQAATLDVLSGGRTRIGVGLGWNEVEYTALNEDFHNRGRRIEEQVQVLRKLWTEPLVEFHGKWHSLPDVGLNPLPVQRPIPIWFGGYVEATLRRVARLGDGWFPGSRNAAEARPSLEMLERFLEEEGRSREEVGIEARLTYSDGNPDEWQRMIADWQAVGATHLSINTMRKGFDTPAAQIAALQKFARAAGLPA